MSRQFSIIITNNIQKTRIQVKKDRENLTQESKTYFKTPTQAILLKPPKPGAVKGYQADVVVNETDQTRLSKLAAAPNGVTVESSETYEVDEGYQG